MADLAHVRSYYEALNAGNADEIASHFTEDATHYYTRLGPHQSGRAIADNTLWAREKINGRWNLESAVEGADEVAIEWSMTWRDPKSGEDRINRGAEFFRFRDGLICEVRAYHHGDSRNPQGDLLGFDHAGRGHAMLDG